MATPRRNSWKNEKTDSIPNWKWASWYVQQARPGLAARPPMDTEDTACVAQCPELREHAVVHNAARRRDPEVIEQHGAPPTQIPALLLEACLQIPVPPMPAEMVHTDEVAL